MNSSNKKVLITGATGLIGRELSPYMQKAGFDVYAITLDDTNPDNGFHWIKGNLFDSHFVEKTIKEISPEYLLNLAWATTGDYLTSNLNYMFLSAGINLLKSFSENGGKRAVFAGTCFEYAFKDTPLQETDPLDASKNTYTFCKNKLHETAELFCIDNGISFGYGRIFYVFGHQENKSRLTGVLLDKLSRGEEVLIKAGPLQKDYMYTKDIAGAFTAFLDKDVRGVVNICTGRAVSIKDYCLLFGRKLGCEHLLNFADDCAGQPRLIVGNNSRLANEVGFTPAYTLETAIDEIVRNIDV